jgi:Tol biopolymer transport system component
MTLVLASLALAGVALGQQSPLVRASVSSSGEQAMWGSWDVALSLDGQLAAFVSSADNLVPGDRNGAGDVLVHDLRTGKTSRVSVSSDGVEADDWSYAPRLSSDGRWVAFHSDATNLVPGDTNGFGDIFVHDRESASTVRASVSSDGRQAALPCLVPALSGDGRVVAFQSRAANLVPGAGGPIQDIFVHDLVTGETTCASRGLGGSQANGDSWVAALSSDGRWVAYSSHATNLVWGDSNGLRDIFVYDRVEGRTSRVSVGTGGSQAAGASTEVSISADGMRVAFTSFAADLAPGDTNNSSDVFVHDRLLGTTVRVSVTSGGAQADNHSAWPVLSPDGRWVAFHSYAGNLVAGDHNDSQDVFLHDLRTGRTVRVSETAAGRGGDQLSSAPAVAGEAATVAFHSYATNLVPHDTNAAADVFVRDR